MSKIKLVGMTACKESILDAIQKTGCVEVASSKNSDGENSSPVISVSGDISSKYEKAERVIDFISENIIKSKNEEYCPKNVDSVLKNFIVSYEEFSNILKKEEKLLAQIDKVKEIEEQFAEIKTSKIKLNNLCAQLEPYVGVKDKLSEFNDTEKVKVFFGTVRQDGLINLTSFVNREEYSQIQLLSNDGAPVILAVALKSDSEKLMLKLNESGFSKCPFNFNQTAKDKVSELMKEIIVLDEKSEKLTASVCGYSEILRELKILTDYYKFVLEKQVNSENFTYTASTFMMEGWLPKESIDEVTESLKQVSSAIFMEFCEPSDDETPPTLTKNGKLVSQAEFITDLYSPPNYRELDPNRVVFFFFMLFMGVIMADIGYGIMMIVLGGILSARIKVDNGAKKLWNIILYSGIFTIIFGILFNSLLGFSVLPFTLLPSPVTGTIDDVMLILLLCLLLGVIQIAVGYFLKAVNCFRQKDILGGIFEGLVWVLFFIGFIFAATNFLLDYLMTDDFILDPAIENFITTVQTPGLIMLLATLAIAVLTAGRNEKGFGKFSKGFGALYGLINIMSDILSYARLFGLMLSGMIIASTFNDIGAGLMAGGALGYAFGILVIIIGHVFNIAMGVLGAYIHDSRLQYIEFFSKFYTGEGDKFTPLGSSFKYIYLKK